MINLPILNKGDAVAIVATARKVNLVDLNYAIQYLDKQGYIPVIGSSIGMEKNQFAGTDQERALDLMQQIIDPKVKAIWCAKGGYGSVRILPYLNAETIKSHPKFLIGYSDVTALHAYWHKLGLPSIHGQMAVGCQTKTNETLASVFTLLKGGATCYKFKAKPFLKTGKVTAPIVGGNLSMLYSICGSRFNFDTVGKILFLEDIDEYLYHIDRMMLNLKNNGLLTKLKGVLIGGLTSMNDNEVPFGKTAEAIIWEHVKDLNCPVAFGFPSGHISDNRAFIQGRLASLEVTDKQVQFKQLAYGCTQ